MINLSEPDQTATIDLTKLAITLPSERSGSMTAMMPTATVIWNGVARF